MYRLLRKNHGIALITVLIILVILVMFIVAFGTIITGSQNNVANYSSNITLEEVAEAGMAYIIYKLNEDPSWASFGPPYETIEKQLDGVKGRFYITFDPAEDYCSINNLTKSNSATRSTKPGGKVPPYTGEIIIKASISDSGQNIKSTKYYSVQLVRGDFFDKHVSSEGPVVIADVAQYIDEGGLPQPTPSVGYASLGAFDKSGIIHTNYDAPGSIKFVSAYPMDVVLGGAGQKGVISTPGDIVYDDNIINIDEDSVTILNDSATSPSGYIDIDGIIAKRNLGGGPPPVALQSGKYDIAREDVTVDDDGDPETPEVFDHYSYTMYFDGSEYNLASGGGWAEIDLNSGDLILKKDIYVSGDEPFNINFNYYHRMGYHGEAPPGFALGDFPARPLAEGDDGDPSTSLNIEYNEPAVRFNSSDTGSK